MAGKKQIHNINSHQIGLDSGLWSCMRMRMRQLCHMEMETKQHVIHVINSHSIHMWDILNIT